MKHLSRFSMTLMCYSSYRAWCFPSLKPNKFTAKRRIISEKMRGHQAATQESNPLRVQERRTSPEGHTCVRGGKTGSCPDLTGILEKLTHLPPGHRDKRHHWAASLAESGPQSGRWRRLSWWPADPTSERAALSVLLAFCSLISAARLWPLLVHVCTSYQLNLPLTL